MTRRWVLPLEDWPAVDRAGWNAAVDSGDLLDDGGLGSRWTEGTRRKYSESYGAWLAFLERSGELDVELAPSERITPERLRAFIDEMIDRGSSRSVALRVNDIRFTLRAMCPGSDLAWLAPVIGRLKARFSPRLARPAPPVSARQIYAAGLQLIEAATSHATNQKAVPQALKFRDGLMLALLIARPLRRRNFVNLEVGNHLLKAHGRYVLNISADETKGRRPLEHPVPVDLTEPLDMYIGQYRMILLDGNRSDRLWITKDGMPFSEMGFSNWSKKLTRRVLGHELRPHAFRHIAATSIATEDPAHARIIAEILGHTTLTTSDRHYNRARQAEAATIYQRHFLALRNRLQSSST